MCIQGRTADWRIWGIHCKTDDGCDRIPIPGETKYIHYRKEVLIDYFEKVLSKGEILNANYKEEVRRNVDCTDRRKN